MDHLKIPNQLSCFGTDTNDAGRIEVVAGSVSAILSVGRSGQGKIHIPQLIIRTKRYPGAHSAPSFRRVPTPSIAGWIARLRHHVEGPQKMTSTGVKSPNVLRRRFGLQPLIPGAICTRDHDNIADYERPLIAVKSPGTRISEVKSYAAVVAEI